MNEKVKFTVSNCNFEKIFKTTNEKRLTKKIKEFGKENGFKNATNVFFENGKAFVKFLGGTFQMYGKLEIIK